MLLELTLEVTRNVLGMTEGQHYNLTVGGSTKSSSNRSRTLSNDCNKAPGRRHAPRDER